jgi:hypothetical protein
VLNPDQILNAIADGCHRDLDPEHDLCSQCLNCDEWICIKCSHCACERVNDVPVLARQVSVRAVLSPYESE